MTSYPQASDPVSALVPYAGATEAHSSMHGRTLKLGTNVLAYGADPTGTTDSLSAFQAAADAVFSGANQAERTVWVPGGTYKFADGTGITQNYDGVHYKGIGTGSGSGAVITVKDAYAFTCTNRVSLRFENINVQMRTGSTSGGAWSTSGGSTMTWDHCKAQGVSGYAGSLFKHVNQVGHMFRRCVAQGPAGKGFDLSAGAGFNNLIHFLFCDAGQCSTAGFYFDSVVGVTLDSCHSETNSGYGIQFATNVSGSEVRSHWFEDNYKTNLLAASPTSFNVENNRFFYNRAPGGGGDAAANHLEFTGTGYFNIVKTNNFQDAPNNKGLVIGASIDGTTVLGCRGLGASQVTDSGTNTRFINSGSGPLSILESGYRFGLDRGVLSGSTSPESTITANIGSIYLRTDGGTSTTLYIKQSGTGNTGWRAAFAASPSSAYTVTNPTTDRGLNVTADTTAQVAQVLGTLIADLQAAGLLG